MSERSGFGERSGANANAVAPVAIGERGERGTREAEGDLRLAHAPAGMRRSAFAAAVRAEVLKGRRAAPRRIALVAPLPFCALGAWAAGVFGGGGAGGAGLATYGWNYWYVLMLPVAVSLICVSVANIDARQKLRPVLGLPIPLQHAWRAKVLYALLLTVAANAVVALCSVTSAAVGGVAPGVLQSAPTLAVTAIGVAWMVPATLFLTVRLGTLAGIAVPLLAQVVLGLVFAQTKLWWAVPMAVALRAPAPVIGVAPSGVPLPPGDPMGTIDPLWFVGLGVAAAVAAGLAAAGTKWFANREAK